MYTDKDFDLFEKLRYSKVITLFILNKDKP